MATKTKSRTKLSIGGPFRHVAGYAHGYLVDAEPFAASPENAPGEQCGFAYRILRIKIRECSTAPDIKILYKLQHAAPDAVGAHRTLHPSLYAYFRLIPKLPCLSFMRFLAFFASGRLP